MFATSSAETATVFRWKIYLSASEDGRLVSRCKVCSVGYNPNYKWINPTYPIYNRGYNPLTKWDEPGTILLF